MDYFCKECSGKPGWPWDEEKAFKYACQRCFRNLPCNDYAWRKSPVRQSPAPVPKDLVREQVNVHSQVDLPRAKGTLPPLPQPVYEVSPPPDFETVHTSAPAPTGIPKADDRNEADIALDIIQPHRPGIKLQAKKK